MAYPTLEQYNEALQVPHLVLQDAELKQGKLKTTGLGLPLALCGGFALTYTVDVGSKRFALRCFHKESRELERRYQAISARIKQLSSPYFLPFEFIPAGIRIQGSMYPVVKMTWASGRTLAEFLEREHRNTQALLRLRKALSALARYLEQNNIAHGDIQPENVMVSTDGSTVQLIDYDGMFVETLRGSTATELGQVNFQHPKRTANDFSEKLDRFSFLTLDVALQALISNSSLWAISRSEPSAVVFRRNDFLDPGSSTIFSEILKLQSVAVHARNLAQVVVGDLQSVPTLEDFLQGKGVSSGAVVFNPQVATATVGYQGAYPVCDATKYDQVFTLVGNRIELIGKIHSVRRGWGANNKPYVFVNFSDWRGRAVKLSIWSDGMKAIEPNIPDQSWIGCWLSITGLVDPPYHGQAKSSSYTHLSITITASGQIQRIPEQEARYRLNGPTSPSSVVRIPSRNTDILLTMGKDISAPASTIQKIPSSAMLPKSSNQQLLEKMRSHSSQNTNTFRSTTIPPQSTTSSTSATRGTSSKTSKASSGSPWGWVVICFIAFGLLRACMGGG